MQRESVYSAIEDIAHDARLLVSDLEHTGQCDSALIALRILDETAVLRRLIGLPAESKQAEMPGAA